MATSARKRPDLLVDTSARWRSRSPTTSNTTRRSRRRRLGLAGHAAFETFSVLTRLPAPARRTPATVARLLAANFPHSRFLGADSSRSLSGRLATIGVAGGSVYDALVGAAAAEHGLRLASRDRRALQTYRALDVEVEFLS